MAILLSKLSIDPKKGKLILGYVEKHQPGYISYEQEYPQTQINHIFSKTKLIV